MQEESLAEYFEKINVNVEILKLFHSGIAIFNLDAILVFANNAYKKMYHFEDREIMGLDAKEFFITANQGIMEVLRHGKPNSCRSVSINGLYGLTFRWPLWDRHGNLAGCLTENISVSSAQDKINNMHQALLELEALDSYSTTLNQRQSKKTVTFDSLVGECPSICVLKEKGRHFALHDEPILIVGENGTGKDLVAQAIHAASARRENNFIAVNCAALPHELIESELFGYEPGAFTGARSTGKQGQFELAHGGTIFLDEIGELPISLQAKLLRVLENHEIQRIGATRPKHVDFRLISATNRNLEQMVNAGTFREDLYYRLNLFDLMLPPLRKRRSDLPLLAHAIITGILGPQRAREINIDNEVMSLWMSHPWHGNVRELRNILTYACYFMRKNETTLSVAHLPERFVRHGTEIVSPTWLPPQGTVNCEARADIQRKPQSHASESQGVSALSGINSRNDSQDAFDSFSRQKKTAEKNALLKALAQCGGNKARAARLLGIARSNLYKKIAQYGL